MRMRLVILSDIHSNIHALESVRSELRRMKRPDAVVCAGDMVGYCAFPNECCRATSELTRSAVLGNHDIAVLERDTSFMNQYASRAAIWTASALDDGSTKWLRSLETEARLRAEDLNVAIYHGSVESYTEYVFEEDAKESMLARARCGLLVLGHTHVPFVKRFATGTIVNPGSVGQPRDGDPRASFAVIDTQSAECEILRVEYDIESAADAIASASLPAFLANRLFMGR